ncbi:MAG: RNA-binding transcriptional accessory protein, partial [Treponema sp.]|nr:RNA-binding transcriptional accessory protein [Candidatus Treponema equi]
MEFTQETIDALQINEVEIMKKVAEELNIRVPQVSAVISLVAEGCTIPFIARYRKEKHGSLDELQVRESDHLFNSYKALEETRLANVRKVFEQGKLTETLYNAFMSAKTLAELEDLYAPFKKKKKTRGMVAIEKGLEPLADAMYELDDAALLAKAAEFVKTDNEDASLNVESAEDAIDGAKDIVAERISQDSKNRADLHDHYMATGTMVTKGIVPDGVDPEKAERESTYKMYWDYSEPLNQVKPHRILAINRAEKEGALEVTI